VPLRFAAVVTILLAYRLLVTFRGIVYRTPIAGDLERHLTR